MSKNRPTLDASQLREIALRLLSRREHSTYELRAKLLARGGSFEKVSATLQELDTEGYLSDTRFTELAVRARLRTNDGPIKIRAYLLQRGIIDSLIKHYLPSDQEFWLERALKLDQLNCMKRSISAHEVTTHEAWSIRSRLLKSRGYPANIIRQVLETVPD
ncbi:MAG: regulatory protein RecX [Gammaproteobacteria bacterium]|nr:regulatory protein RecX [Gammaproteobacteria bacterium]MXW07512.1 regulatory protein RecX [Gammaproteobacteria bacterium]MYC24765.1 regulatory protein RecX [Gammaproteobacteria bacterium]